VVYLLINNNILNDELINFSSTINKENNYFYTFIYITKFILINTIKYYLNTKNVDNLEFKEDIKKIFKFIPIYKIIDMINFININEKKINDFNLDKKLFVINFFSLLSVK